MSRILVIEPHRMLQRAFAVSFCPEHEVQLIDSIPPESPTTNNYDAVVIDAAALRERSGSDEGLEIAGRSWAMPTVWIEDKHAAVPARPDLVVIRKPIGRDELLSALSSVSASAKTGGQVPAPTGEGEPESPPIIDLVEVVEQAEANPSEASPLREKSK